MHVPAIEWRVLAGYLIFLASNTVVAFGRFPGLKVDRAGAAIITLAIGWAWLAFVA